MRVSHVERSCAALRDRPPRVCLFLSVNDASVCAGGQVLYKHNAGRRGYHTSRVRRAFVSRLCLETAAWGKCAAVPALGILLVENDLKIQ